MREIRFDPDFWPRMHNMLNRHELVQKVWKNDAKWTDMTAFLKSMSKELTLLSIENLDKIRYDFDTYPRFDRNVNNGEITYDWRCLNIYVKDINAFVEMFWRFESDDVIYIKSDLSMRYA